MPLEPKTPESGAVIPDIIVTPAGKNAILRWVGQVRDRYNTRVAVPASAVEEHRSKRYAGLVERKET